VFVHLNGRRMQQPLQIGGTPGSHCRLHKRPIIAAGDGARWASQAKSSELGRAADGWLAPLGVKRAGRWQSASSHWVHGRNMGCSDSLVGPEAALENPPSLRRGQASVETSFHARAAPIRGLRDMPCLGLLASSLTLCSPAAVLYISLCRSCRTVAVDMG
jgi:hypothetical protein